MELNFEQICFREKSLKRHFPKLNKHKRHISRLYFGLGKDWSKIGEFNKAKKYLWSAFLSWPLGVRPLAKIIRINIKSGHYGYGALRRNRAIKKILRDQRVLIIGSGPSANDLSHVPGDVKIATCNIGPRILLDKGIDRRIDLYYCVPGAVEGDHKSEKIINILSKLKINLFVYPTKWIKNDDNLKKVYTKCVKDYMFNDYYLIKLIGPQETEEIKKNPLFSNVTSSGVRLLQYALYAKAKEIFLLGIDLNEEGYFWGKKNKHDHLSIDKKFIERVSKKYNNIYSASKDSPIVRYVGYKPLLDN
jgi:hypothetical protein